MPAKRSITVVFTTTPSFLVLRQHYVLATFLQRTLIHRFAAACSRSQQCHVGTGAGLAGQRKAVALRTAGNQALLRSKLTRHMRRGKTVRWHIDQLSEAGTVGDAWAFPHGTECALVEALATLPVPIDGFGSSDCQSCRSHLLHSLAAKVLSPLVLYHRKGSADFSNGP